MVGAMLEFGIPEDVYRRRGPHEENALSLETRALG